MVLTSKAPRALCTQTHTEGIIKMQKKKLTKGILILTAVVFSALLLCAVIVSSAEPETIQCTAQGTSTQMGQQFTLNITINEYSTEEDRQTLIQAFEKDKSQGLAKALAKLPTRGRMQTPGTTGYELKFVRLLPNSPPGTRKIRIVTDRPITIGESRQQSRSLDYNLSVVELELNEVEEKSTGTLLPLCELKIDKKTKELTVEVRKNPFNLVNFFRQGK
jgi:hypothetical protein